MKFRNLLAALFLSGCSLCVVGCAPKDPIPVKQMPAGASYEGRWYTNFGTMDVEKNPDGSFFGKYDYHEGGELSGKVEGGVMVFEWLQYGDLQHGTREMKGHGFFVISDDGLKLAGKWGYHASYSNGGDWTGDKATEIY